mmetsp:Transcript_86599/g.136653  ORF Transcript_86599/g.136653 Transcript_86599/m.136653 type:complete len:99 (-) Transcript_86599:525-821(-)
MSIQKEQKELLLERADSLSAREPFLCKRLHAHSRSAEHPRNAYDLQVFIIISNCYILGFLQFSFMLLYQGVVDLDLWGFCKLPNELQVRLISKTTSKP